jgi:hypothetical protein
MFLFNIIGEIRNNGSDMVKSNLCWQGINGDFSPYSILFAQRLDKAGKGDDPDEFDPPCNAESSTTL